MYFGTKWISSLTITENKTKQNVSSRNFGGATIRQDGWVAEHTVSYSEATFSSQPMLHFWLQLFLKLNHAVSLKGLIQTIAPEVCMVTGDFKCIFFFPFWKKKKPLKLSRAKLVSYMYNFIFWVRHTYLSTREKSFNFLCTPVEAPKIKQQPLILFLFSEISVPLNRIISTACLLYLHSLKTNIFKKQIFLKNQFYVLPVLFIFLLNFRQI